MIDEIGANWNVTLIKIQVNNISDQINEKTIKLMISRYPNVFDIFIADISDSVNNTIHNELKQLVKCNPLKKFKIKF